MTTAADGEKRRGLPSALLRLARPQQWTKNVLVLAAPGAAGVLLEGRSIVKTFIAFVCFCLAASGTYYWNDALDVDADRMHPKKRSRPVASGEVSVPTAQRFGSVLLVAAIALSFAATWHLALVVGGYVVITLAYSIWLKHEAVLDLAAVASGFVLRTVAGGVAVGVSISNWFLIVAASGAMFVVTGKRSAEHTELGQDAGLHRRSLVSRPAAYLGYVRAISSTIAILAPKVISQLGGVEYQHAAAFRQASNQAIGRRVGRLRACNRLARIDIDELLAGALPRQHIGQRRGKTEAVGRRQQYRQGWRARYVGNQPRVRRQIDHRSRRRASPWADGRSRTGTE